MQSWVAMYYAVSNFGRFFPLPRHCLWCSELLLSFIVYPHFYHASNAVGLLNVSLDFRMSVCKRSEFLVVAALSKMAVIEFGDLRCLIRRRLSELDIA